MITGYTGQIKTVNNLQNDKETANGTAQNIVVEKNEIINTRFFCKIQIEVMIASTRYVYCYKMDEQSWSTKNNFHEDVDFHEFQ